MCLSAIFAFQPQATTSLKTVVQWAQAYQKKGDHQSFVDFSASSTCA